MNEKLKELLSKLNWWQKMIVIIALGVVIFFTSSCGLKSFYHADNVTHEVDVFIEE